MHPKGQSVGLPIRWKSFARSALDLVLPPSCLGCGEPVGDPQALCPACFARMEFLGEPCCACCGHPFDLAAPGELCASCLASHPSYDRARAVFAYTPDSRNLVLDLKHRDRLEGIPAFAGWLARVGKEALADADLIAPVPLSRLRLFSRRFNQSAELARALSRRSGIPVAVDLLLRLRHTESQARKSRLARRRNIRGAIGVNPARLPLPDDAHIVLIDDVLTTGATVGECARMLKKAGAAQVSVLTLARVVLAGQGKG